MVRTGQRVLLGFGDWEMVIENGGADGNTSQANPAGTPE
jgi:hypothetical protein